MVGTMDRAETEAGRKWQEDTHGRLDLVLLKFIPFDIFYLSFEGILKL